MRGRLRRTARARGELVRAALAGAWRENPPPLHLEEGEVAEIAPLLLTAGSAPLVWRRLRRSALEQPPAVDDLKQAYRVESLQASVRERSLARVLGALDAAGVEALLLKGWLAARLYPESGLRPYADHDLCVRPADLAAARAALAGVDVRVDLHPGLGRVSGHAVWLEQSFDELLDAAVPVEVDGVRARGLGAEDHLTLMCFHALTHEIWRPIWLCDVAAALETRPGTFDWERCLAGAGAGRAWFAAMISLAHALLGASIQDVPADVGVAHPAWLERTVLARWGTHPDVLPGVGTPRPDLLAASLEHRFGSALRTRWPRPIEVSLGLGVGPTARPRLPYQVGVLAVRTLRFGSRLPLKLAHERRRRLGGVRPAPRRPST